MPRQYQTYPILVGLPTILSAVSVQSTNSHWFFIYQPFYQLSQFRAPIPIGFLSTNDSISSVSVQSTNSHWSFIYQPFYQLSQFRAPIPIGFLSTNDSISCLSSEHQFPLVFYLPTILSAVSVQSTNSHWFFIYQPFYQLCLSSEHQFPLAFYHIRPRLRCRFSTGTNTIKI